MKIGERVNQVVTELRESISINDQHKIDELTRYSMDKGFNAGMIIGGFGLVLGGLIDVCRLRYARWKKPV